MYTQDPVVPTFRITRRVFNSARWIYFEVKKLSTVSFCVRLSFVALRPPLFQCEGFIHRFYIEVSSAGFAADTRYFLVIVNASCNAPHLRFEKVHHLSWSADDFRPAPSNLPPTGGLPHRRLQVNRDQVRYQKRFRDNELGMHTFRHHSTYI